MVRTVQDGRIHMVPYILYSFSNYRLVRMVRQLRQVCFLPLNLVQEASKFYVMTCTYGGSNLGTNIFPILGRDNNLLS